MQSRNSQRPISGTKNGLSNGKKQAWLMQMSHLLSVLSNVSRLEIIMLLCHGELTVGVLADAVWP